LKGADYAKQLYSYLEPLLPKRVRDLVSTGKIAIGEIGIPTINAQMIPLGNGLYVIELFSGLQQFLYRVSRALATRCRVHIRSSQSDVVEPSLTPEQTIDVIREIFLNYKMYRRSMGPDYPIQQEQINYASDLATNAEMFALAHEIGHAMVYLIRADSSMAQELSKEEEFKADDLAIMTMLGAMRSGNEVTDFTWDARMAYAGSEFLLRVFAGLETLGVKFSESHPPAKVRLQNLRMVARNVYERDADFTSVRTVAAANDELLEDIEIVIRSAAPAHEVLELKRQDPERLTVKLLAMLEECARGTDSEQACLEKISMSVNGVPEGVLRESVRALTQTLADRSEEHRQTREREVAILMRMIDRLPEPAKLIFDRAFR
jgi:hypothetical protein